MSSPTDAAAGVDDPQAATAAGVDDPQPATTGQEIAVTEALVLGALHGPAELLPISSSGHIAVIPWLLDWEYRDVDAELRKAFEVALHAGTAAALLITLRSEVSDAVRGMSLRLAELVVLSFVPPAIVGYTLERPIERYLGTPQTIALGLVAGSLAMAWADRAPQTRTSRDAGAADALWLGIAQACALLPGVSRNGATLAAARRRRFTREDANKLSRHVALPVIAGATLLKTVRLARRGLPPRSALPIAVGAGASFASTLGSTWLIRQVERDRSLLPYAVYRIGLAAVIVGRLAARRRPAASAPAPPPRRQAESDPYTTMAT
ncbi:MAG: undecaprenyl-diphosphate phosphatase [Solirubrobacteraceae bacterium]